MSRTGLDQSLRAPRGREVLENPLLNKGSAFTDGERRSLGLLGLLPPHVSTPDEQLARAYENFQRKTSDLERYVFLASCRIATKRCSTCCWSGTSPR